MKAADAVQEIFAEAGWSFKPEETEGLLNAAVELEAFKVSFSVFAEEAFLLSCPLQPLPENEEERFNLLKKAAALCALVWQEHKINLTVCGDLLNLELAVSTQEPDFKEKVRVFLDDCDCFAEQLDPQAPSALAADLALLRL